MENISQSNYPDMFGDCKEFGELYNKRTGKHFQGRIDRKFIRQMVLDELDELDEAKDEAEKIKISAENTKISNELEQQNINSNEKENIERLNKEQKRVEDEINYGVRRIKAEQEENAKLDKQKKIYANQGLMSRERLDKDIQKKQQNIESELKKEIDAKIEAEAAEAAKIKNAAEEAKKAKETLQNQINETNNDNIKNLIEKEKKEKEENKKRIQDLQAAEKIKAKANKLDPFAGGRTTRKFSSPVSRKTRRRKQTSR